MKMLVMPKSRGETASYNQTLLRHAYMQEELLDATK